MKIKMVLFLSLVVLALMLTACNDNEGTASDDESEKDTVENTEEVETSENVTENTEETEEEEPEEEKQTEDNTEDVNGYGEEAYNVVLANEESAMNGDIDEYMNTLSSDNATDEMRNIYTKAFETTDYQKYETHFTEVLEATEDKVVIEVKQTITYEDLEKRATYEADNHFKHTLIREEGEYKIQNSEMLSEDDEEEEQGTNEETEQKIKKLS